MPLLTSGRELRLWFWTLIIVIGIFSSLRLTATLAGLLNDQEVIAAAFLGCMLLVGASIVTQGLQVRPGGLEIAVLLGITSVYLMLILRMTLQERSHLIEFGVVAVFVYGALRERVKNGGRPRRPAFIAILLTGLIGVLDESIQAFLPERVFDPQDMLFNLLAAVMAVLASLALTWARRNARRIRPK